MNNGVILSLHREPTFLRLHRTLKASKWTTFFRCTLQSLWPVSWLGKRAKFVIAYSGLVCSYSVGSIPFYLDNKVTEMRNFDMNLWEGLLSAHRGAPCEGSQNKELFDCVRNNAASSQQAWEHIPLTTTKVTFHSLVEFPQIIPLWFWNVGFSPEVSSSVTQQRQYCCTADFGEWESSSSAILTLTLLSLIIVCVWRWCRMYYMLHFSRKAWL